MLYRDDFADMIDFKVEVNVLPQGAFAHFTEQRRAEGADLAHLKPPHINPSQRVLDLLTEKPAEVVRVSSETTSETAAVR